MVKDSNIQAFLALVRAGLWERGVELRKYGTTDFSEILQLATEQSVVGLVAAGLERVKDMKIPQEWALQFAGQTLQLEQRNKAMNAFIAELIEKLRKAEVYTLLVKGQGVAQCYDKPLWRASGDVDLYLSKDNYENAKVMLLPIAQSVEQEDKGRLHLGMTIDDWVVELHGTMHTKLSRRMNRVADEVHEDIFYRGNIRSWMNNWVQIFLPSADNDVIIIFNHIINHFFMEGEGLRQICDWCRLLWVYRQNIDVTLLEKRLKKMGLVTEWKAFFNLASRYLSLPDMGEGLLACDFRFDKRADRIMAFVMESGNFGHNRDVSYRAKNPAHVANAITLWRRICDFARFARIFPLDSPKFFCQYCLNRVTRD